MGSDQAFQISWRSEESSVFMNPRLTMEIKGQSARILEVKKRMKGHFWIQSSGSTQKADESQKWFALSKEAFLASAGGVNQHLSVTKSDKWGLMLPLFHVGGLSILARAYLSHSKVEAFEMGWAAHPGHLWLTENKITLVSLVPAQMHDLVQEKLKAPPSLRAVIIGGGKLSDELAKDAKALGWPVLASYGMTELCSQVATATSANPTLQLLPHIEAKTDSEGYLWLRSPALFTGFLQERQNVIYWDECEKIDGFWRSPDRAKLKDRILTPLGREGDYVKINGEGLDLMELRARFGKFAHKKVVSTETGALVAVPDQRSGVRLVLAVENFLLEWKKIVSDWNVKCFPLERLEIEEVDSIPRSPLGKVLWEQLATQLK